MFYPEMKFPPINLYTLPYKQEVVVIKEGSHIRTEKRWVVDSSKEVERLLNLRKLPSKL